MPIFDSDPKRNVKRRMTGNVVLPDLFYKSSGHPFGVVV